MIIVTAGPSQGHLRAMFFWCHWCLEMSRSSTPVTPWTTFLTAWFREVENKQRQSSSSSSSGGGGGGSSNSSSGSSSAKSKSSSDSTSHRHSHSNRQTHSAYTLANPWCSQALWCSEALWCSFRVGAFVNSRSLATLSLTTTCSHSAPKTASKGTNSSSTLACPLTCSGCLSLPAPPLPCPPSSCVLVFLVVLPPPHPTLPSFFPPQSFNMLFNLLFNLFSIFCSIFFESFFNLCSSCFNLFSTFFQSFFNVCSMLSQSFTIFAIVLQSFSIFFNQTQSSSNNLSIYF